MVLTSVRWWPASEACRGGRQHYFACFGGVERVVDWLWRLRLEVAWWTGEMMWWMGAEDRVLGLERGRRRSINGLTGV